MQRILFAAVLLLSVIGCQKDFSIDGGSNNNNVDLTTKVTARAISGFVTDENDAPVTAAMVKIGTQTISTDEYGFFEVSDVEVSKNAATVTVSQVGYFPGIRTFMAVAGKDNFVRIKLLPKTDAGSISASNGGSVTLTNGLKIALPANAVVTASGGAAYSGTVNVAAQWINPKADDLDRIMPGDLRAIDADNNMKLLVTYGMGAVELTGSGGEKLQVAPGKKATLTLPLPAAIAGAAPASIPLWHFDEAKGLWIEEGSAIKVGNTYEGEVSHFSFWNCDVPIDYVQLNMTVKNAAGIPVSYARVKLTTASNSNNSATGITDSSGFVQGAVPANSQLLVEIFYDGCSTALHTQTIVTGSTNVSLGTINITNNVSFATITGTVTNCSNLPVTNGRVIVKSGNTNYSYWIAPDGTYNVGASLCNLTSLPISIIAEDIGAGQQSSLTNYSITAGNNALGNIQACGTSTDQFVNVSINGTPYSFLEPADSLAYFNNTQIAAYVSAFRSTGTGTINTIEFTFSNTALAVGSIQLLSLFNTSYITEPYNITPPQNVSITEYGAIGQFIAGNFTLTATGTNPPNTTYNTTVSFRLRRFN